MRALTNEKMAIYIACNLKRIREKSGLTQEEVAKQAGINRVAYTQYETAKRGVIGVMNLTKIAYVLNTSFDDLLYGVLDEMRENDC